MVWAVSRVQAMVTAEIEDEEMPIDLSGAGLSTRSENSNGYVSLAYHRQTADATQLCLYNVISKLNRIGTYNIGSTFSRDSAEFHFFFTTNPCHGHNYLLNIFVQQKNPGNFSIQISDSPELKHKAVPEADSMDVFAMLPKTFETFKFKSTKLNKVHYIKTFCFGSDLTMTRESTNKLQLLVPIKITVNPKLSLDANILRSVKLRHDLSSLLTKQEKTDFVLESATHKQFLTHKILLAAHSPVLRNMMKNSMLTSLFIDISDHDMELLLQFIYTGTIMDVNKQDCTKLLEIADKFQLKALFLLTQNVIENQIKVENAIEMAIIAKRYKLDALQNKVFDFILKHPEVMKTKAFKELKDVELTKYLIQYMQMRD